MTAPCPMGVPPGEEQIGILNMEVGGPFIGTAFDHFNALLLLLLVLIDAVVTGLEVCHITGHGLLGHEVFLVSVFGQDDHQACLIVGL